jgi:hypothetical protein
MDARSLEYLDSRFVKDGRVRPAGIVTVIEGRAS